MERWGGVEGDRHHGGVSVGGGITVERLSVGGPAATGQEGNSREDEIGEEEKRELT